MVIDYRALDKITFKDRFPLPHPEDLIVKLHGMKYFTKLDFWSGFHQHRCHPETIEQTAFIGPGALYEWLVCVIIYYPAACGPKAHGSSSATI